MAFLFQLPRVVSLPGSTLTFTQTGTTTPQNTYQDADLTTPHANPVEADAAGSFDPIFLDPTLPDYRVRHETSTGVLIYQEDDIPSNQNVQQSMRLESTNPFVFLYDTDGTSGSRKYRVRAAGAAFEVQASNEAEDTFTTILQFTGGVLYSNATEVAVTTSGSFTGTLTGCTTAPTATFSYRTVNNLVSIWLDSNLTATSNTTSMSITGLPAAISPATAKRIWCSQVVDNGSVWVGSVGLGSGNLNFAVATASLANVTESFTFTNSGSKGVQAGWCITYPLS